MCWIQSLIELSPYPRGFHLITHKVLAAVPQIVQIRVGILHIHIMHTSASLTVNENADPDVRVDLETAFSAIAPEDFPYCHTCEGPDDMPAHVKASLLGNAVSFPVCDGKLLNGTWQGIYLCEHRDHADGRQIVATLNGKMGQRQRG